MTRHRTSLPHGLLLSAVAAATVWATMLSWAPMTDGAARFVVPLFIAGALTALTGATLRSWRVPTLLVVAAQVVLLGLFVLWTQTGSVLPSTDNLATLVASVADAVDSANRYQSPVPLDVPPVTPLFLLAGVGALVLVDLLALSLSRVAVSGLVLMALYSVPASLDPSGSSWWVFGLMAGGFLLLLFLQQDDQVSRWGRGVSGEDVDADPSAFGVRTGAVRSSALVIGAVTTALALVVPVLVPTFGLALWDGIGPGDGDGISIENPLVDMRRDLDRGEDIPLLRVATEGRKPTYVRMSVLNRYNGDEWSSGDRDVPTTQLAQGDMPPLTGVNTSLSREETLYTFEATSDFRSQWLPTTPLVSQITAPGDWRYDRTTMDFLSGDPDLTTAGLSWRLRGVQLEYDAAVLDATTSGVSQVGSDLVQVPANMPGIVRSLTAAVTGQEPTRFRKARALQEWFRTEFTYSLDQVDSVGNSELAAFLDQGGREGYCEQFASAMAIMARLLDIPSRVAVGFLEPTEVGPSLWEFSSHDLHAWPELYFPGSGWVRFEPTPPDRASGVPDYTQADLPVIEESVRPGPTQASEDLPERAPDDEAAPEAAPDEQDEAGASVPWVPLLGGLAALGLVLVLVLAPRALRARRRERRRHAGDIESLWDELRDTVVDLGHRWPGGRSPQGVAAHVTGWFGADEGLERPRRGSEAAPEAARSLDLLVRALERARYARPGTSPDHDDSWRDALETCVAALRAGVTSGARRRADWWPASVLRRRTSPASETSVSSVTTSAVGMVDHVG